MFDHWRHKGDVHPFGDYVIVHDLADGCVHIFDGLDELVFRSKDAFGKKHFSVLSDGKMFIAWTEQGAWKRDSNSFLRILDTSFDDNKRSSRFYLCQFLQQQSLKSGIEVKSFCTLILSMCTS
jgi:hypothetical protein